MQSSACRAAPVRKRRAPARLQGRNGRVHVRRWLRAAGTQRRKVGGQELQRQREVAPRVQVEHLQQQPHLLATPDCAVNLYREALRCYGRASTGAHPELPFVLSKRFPNCAV
jgi:hypothetical protein